MTNLLKADFKRIFKDKLFFVVCIIGLVFAVLTPFINFGMLELLSSQGMQSEEIEFLTGGQITAKYIFFMAFSPANDFGLIMPILFAVILCKDFSQGTVRNKILSGKSRSQIFLSTYISTAIMFVALILIYAFMSLGVSLILFDYSTTPFTINDFWYALGSVGLWIAVYLAISAIVCLIAYVMKNVGLTMVMVIAVSMGVSLIGGLISMAGGMLQYSNQFLADLLTIVANALPFSASHGLGVSFNVVNVIVSLLASIAMAVGFVFLGIKVFNKKDLK